MCANMFAFPHLFYYSLRKQLLTEISFVERTFEYRFARFLKFGECEFAREKMSNDIGVLDLGPQSRNDRFQYFVVIVSELGHTRKWNPCSAVHFARLDCSGLIRAEQSHVRDRNHAPTPVAIDTAKRIYLFDVATANACFFIQYARDGLIRRLMRPYQGTRQCTLAFESRYLRRDEPDMQNAVYERKRRRVRRKRRKFYMSRKH